MIRPPAASVRPIYMAGTVVATALVLLTGVLLLVDAGVLAARGAASKPPITSCVGATAHVVASR